VLGSLDLAQEEAKRNKQEEDEHPNFIDNRFSIVKSEVIGNWDAADV
jgi:hypothetical protein